MHNLLVVVGWTTGALLSFSAMAVSIREVAPALGLFDLLAVRNAVAIGIVLAAAVLTGQVQALRPQVMRLHLARNIVHFLGTYGWALGVTLLPLGVVFALEFTTPAWVTLFAALLLRERLTPSRVGSVVLGFAGVLVILRPGLEALQPASLLVLGVALCFAGTAVVTKLLTRTQPTLAILFWMNVIQLPLSLVCGRFAAPAAQPFEWHHALALAVVCVSGLSSHWCLTKAYTRGDAILVVPLDFLRIPLIALVGWQLYNERLDPFVFAGTLLIVSGLLWNLRQEARAT